ncbi:hypothetical protein A8806_10538 [Faecalicatena orotica]|uniref:Uncharacterized protein n=1 Tax=Faecalicatena orotica TaxID=1544 RepID=A0A2Y9BGP7_9FIRM|nr:hypothetical protein A8806_10538 [Faecalicatena orotica]SSA55462.1 hypothetical protein SAMN05216536_10538 [Faecalicatena orotica]
MVMEGFFTDFYKVFEDTYHTIGGQSVALKGFNFYNEVE